MAEVRFDNYNGCFTASFNGKTSFIPKGTCYIKSNSDNSSISIYVLGNQRVAFVKMSGDNADTVYLNGSIVTDMIQLEIGLMNMFTTTRPRIEGNNNDFVHYPPSSSSNENDHGSIDINSANVDNDEVSETDLNSGAGLDI